MAPTVSKEVAQKDFEKWLDAKRVSESKRLSMADSIESLVNSVCDGTLIVNDDSQLVQILDVPIGEESKLDKLTYKLRISVDDTHKRMVNNQVKTSDGDGRLRVYVSALTNQSYQTIGKMDSTDYSLATTIAGFFL